MAFLFVVASREPLEIGEHDTERQRQVLRDAFTHAGWEADEILTAMGADDLYFDAVAQTRMMQWSHGRVALVGDAAYCPSLLAGQGAAFAVAGAYVLAHMLSTSAGRHDVACSARSGTAFSCRIPVPALRRLAATTSSNDLR